MGVWPEKAPPRPGRLHRVADGGVGGFHFCIFNLHLRGYLGVLEKQHLGKRFLNNVIKRSREVK